MTTKIKLLYDPATHKPVMSEDGRTLHWEGLPDEAPPPPGWGRACHMGYRFVLGQTVPPMNDAMHGWYRVVGFEDGCPLLEACP